MTKLNQKHWIDVTCPTCKGSGRRGNRVCPLCKGARKIKVPPLSDKDDD